MNFNEKQDDDDALSVMEYFTDWLAGMSFGDITARERMAS